MDQRRLFRIKVTMLNRSDFRSLFGLEFANQCGHFLDRWMSALIHSYADWIEYPKGDHILMGDPHHEVLIALVSSDGYYLFTGSTGKQITMWDLRSDTQIGEWMAHDYGTMDFAYTPRRRWLISCSIDPSIRIWDTTLSESKDKLVSVLKGHSGMVTSLDVNHSGMELVSCSEDKTIRLWSLNDSNQECLRVFNGHLGEVHCVIFMNDSILLSAGSDSCVRVWNKHDDSTDVQSMDDDQDREALTMTVNCDASMIAVTFDGTAYVYHVNPDDSDHIIVTDGSESPIRSKVGVEYVNCVCFHPTLPGLLALGKDVERKEEMHYELDIYDVIHDNQCVFHREQGHTQSITQLCFTPDGTRMITTSDESTIHIWDISHLK